MSSNARLLVSLLFCLAAVAARAQRPSPRSIDLKAGDGTVLKGSYFAAGKPGPGVLLVHQSNRDRKSWEPVAAELADAGINTLTLDMRGFGESGGTKRSRAPEDIEAAMGFLQSQPGVDRDAIGLGGAGWLGVLHSVEAARRHPAEVKSLVLMSGETERDGLDFLRQATRLPELFVFSDDDEYPPTQDAMKLLYVTASSPSKKLVHYSSAEDAPWRWYETFDAGRVPAHGGHGTDMFGVHPELPGIIVHWFVTTLIRTPGHAPADTLASGATINQIQAGDVDGVRQRLVAARQQDPRAQLFPEIAASIIGQDHMRAGDNQKAVAVLELVRLAYPDSADAEETLSEAYLANGQKDLARQHAQRALDLLRSHALPASSWTDTKEYRGTIEEGAQKVLDQTAVPGPAASRAPGSVFRDCGSCPEMVVIPAGAFTMGSSDAAKAWAVTQGASPRAIADESPAHTVTLRSFALGKYDVTRAEYAAFVRDTGYSAGPGCHVAGSGMDNSKWPNPSDRGWRDPGFTQTDREPVVCVSWEDARAYIAWLNRKIGGTALGPYRLPSESEWEYAARAATTSHFYWGDEAVQAAAHAWFRDNSGARTHPVGEKPPNAFGLYDIVGNVWQWTEDCYADDYGHAPADGAAATGPPDCLRVDRGGSWFYPAWLLRPTTRERNPGNGYRDVVMGFRVARALP